MPDFFAPFRQRRHAEDMPLADGATERARAERYIALRACFMFMPRAAPRLRAPLLRYAERPRFDAASPFVAAKMLMFLCLRQHIVAERADATIAIDELSTIGATITLPL